MKTKDVSNTSLTPSARKNTLLKKKYQNISRDGSLMQDDCLSKDVGQIPIYFARNSILFQSDVSIVLKENNPQCTNKKIILP